MKSNLTMIIGVTIMLGIVIMGNGCSKTLPPRERFINALHESFGTMSEEELQKEVSHFDESDAKEQLRQADYAEYFAYLDKTTRLDTRTIKRTVSLTFEGKSEQERAKILEGIRKVK